MPDVETELQRFGRWLDTEIESSTKDLAVRPLVPADASGHGRSSARGRARLTATVGIAAALALGVLVVSKRAASPPARVDPVSTSDESIARATVAGTSSSTSSSTSVGASTTVADRPVSSATTAPAAPRADPRLVLPGVKLPDGYTMSTTVSGSSLGPTPEGVSVLYGRRGADDSWTDLLVVQISSLLPSRPEPDRPKQVARGCGCATAVVGGRWVDVAGASSEPDRIGAAFDDVVLGSGVDFTWASGAPPDGLEEIARASGPDPARATAQVAGPASTGGAAYVNGEATDGSIAGAVVQTASVPVDAMLATSLPITSAGTLRSAGAEWRYESEGEWAVVKVVSPGTVTSVRVDPLFDRAVAETILDSLHLVDANAWVAGGTRRTATYAVASGDTLPGIADKLGVTYAQLVAANPGLDPEKFLVVGQRLSVPGS